MTRAEVQLCDFLHDIDKGEKPGEGRLGSFFSHLFHAIALADPKNLRLLNEGFDDQVNVWKRYKQKAGYGPKLLAEYNRGR